MNYTKIEDFFLFSPVKYFLFVWIEFRFSFFVVDLQDRHEGAHLDGHIEGLASFGIRFEICFFLKRTRALAKI